MQTANMSEDHSFQRKSFPAALSLSGIVAVSQILKAVLLHQQASGNKSVVKILSLVISPREIYPSNSHTCYSRVQTNKQKKKEDKSTEGK